MRRALLPLLVFLALAAVSCGYSLQPEGSGRFSDPATRVDLPPFRNDTAEGDAGAYVALKLREELRQRGFVGLYEHNDADFLIAGRVREYRDEVLSNVARFALENRFTLVLEIRVTNAQTGSVLWKEENLRESVSYYSGPDPEYTASNRRAAFEEAARRIVRRMAQTVRLIL